ncbi:MAG: HlyC/CorC family transporter [Fretibacterium sp.]|nr:HlyC/CorC family transporter [Fretibacterium sp.]
MLFGIVAVLLLGMASAFFSVSEISLAASRRMKLRPLADKGDVRAARVLSFQEQPGLFFTTVQIGLNFVAILAGIVGDASFAPLILERLPHFIPEALRGQIASAIPFIGVTLFFVLFADQIPKRIAMALPEKTSMAIIEGMRRVILLCGPLARALNATSGAVYRLLGLPEKRRDDITSDDLYAVMEAGTVAGLLRKQEKDLIGNVFELDARAVPSAMTARENIVWFDLHEDEGSIKEKIARESHSTYLVCDKDIDHIIGYVDSKELLGRVLRGESGGLALDKGLAIRSPLILPDTLTLAEAMDYFKGKGEDLAVVLNEYALVVGILTLQDIMLMLMGTLVGEEEQITKRDESSWLLEGATPIEDVAHVLKLDMFPDEENYETIGGFMTYMLRRIPHRMDSVVYGGYKFEVMDTENYRIGQILVSRLPILPEKGGLECEGSEQDLQQAGTQADVC